MTSFTLNSTSGVGIFADGDGGGLSVTGSDINIFNNIIFGNTATGEGDDVFVVDTFDGDDNTGDPVNLFNNDFSDFFSLCENTAGCTPDIMEGNNINADPLFADAAGGDVHLQSDSPVIDAGDPDAPALPDTDFEGDLRDSLPDIGADEFSETPPDGDGGQGGCSVAGGSVNAGQSLANALLPLIPAFMIGLRMLKRKRK